MNHLTTSVLDVPGGRLSVRDTGGEGPLVLFVHGALVDGRLWDAVWPAVAEAGYRCAVPDLPLGAHRIALDPGADRSPLGQARRIAGLIGALGADRATLVGNDTGGALCQILAAEDPAVVDRLVLTPADALSHFPPTAFRALPLMARSPRLLSAALWPLSRGPGMLLLGRLLAKRPIPAALLRDWLGAIYRDPGVLADLAGLIAPMRPSITLDAAERLRSFPRAALLAWAPEDRFFPFSDAEKLAAMIPQGRLVAIHDSYTFTPLDQPDATAQAIISFLRDTEQHVEPEVPGLPSQARR
jgi:pimeloyl-ACP methyl ester carboxylesterase